MRGYKVRSSELQGTKWFNTDGKNITLNALRGKVVLLDFWTSCCINCLHVIDELRSLEEKYHDVLVVIGVHSPKFEHERSDKVVEDAIERYGVHHPVLNDPDMRTWQEYAARSWPTLAVIDPEGYYVGSFAGEGHLEALDSFIGAIVDKATAQGVLHRGKGPYVPPKGQPGTLRFPGKVIDLGEGHEAKGHGRFLVTDSGHHSVVALERDLETVVRRYGDGSRGYQDGGWNRETSISQAQFNEPQGVLLVPRHLKQVLGYDIIVADTVNHRLRSINLDTGEVATRAGNGRQRLLDAASCAADKDSDFLQSAGNALSISLSSPWDLAWSAEENAVIISMAGTHQIFAFDPVACAVWILAGTGIEGLRDGDALNSWFAQSSGIDCDSKGVLWVADSETSALRKIEVLTPRNKRTSGDIAVRTAVGTGLFDFGFRDGAARQALLQHPLGVRALPNGSIAIADTYNGAIRSYSPETEQVSTVVQGLGEPSDILVDSTAVDGQLLLIVVESSAHRLTRLAISQEVLNVDNGAGSSSRPLTPLAAGEVVVRVNFTVPEGQKLDDRWGPPTQLKISGVPESLVVSGAGIGDALERTVVLSDVITNGVLNVMVRAASCEGGESTEHATCRLYKQDCSIPIIIKVDAPKALDIDLSETQL